MASLTPITGLLGLTRAAHLLRRASFGPTKTEIESFAAMNVTTALNTLLAIPAVPAPPNDPLTGASWLPKPDPETNSGDDSLFEYFQAWFLELMRTTRTNLRERMVFFLHSHMPGDHSLIQNSTSLYNQNALYRQYAFGNFKELFTKVCVDNAMLLYIDNTLNDYGSPNENFAREMLELYTIGKGDQIGPEDYTNYTETDVKEAARVLTGFKHNFDFDTIDNDGFTGTNTNLPRGKVTTNAQTQAYRHDPGTKTFTSKFQNTVIAPNPTLMFDGYATEEGAFDELNQMMDMIFNQDETAKFICRKLYRYFVYYKIDQDIEDTIITPLANTLRTNNYELSSVLEELLSSEHFYDEDSVATSDDHIGAIIKSPVDLVVGTFGFFKITMPDPGTALEDLYDFAYGRGILRDLKNQGMKFYKPIDVAGYPAYHQVPAFNRNWITPNWLARRYQFGYQILNGVENESSTIVYKLDIVAYVDDVANISDAYNARTIVTELTDFMFTKTIPTERYDYFLDTIFLEGNMESHWTDEWTAYKGGGDDTVVRSLLEQLVSGLMQSPEYQLY